MLQQAKRVNKSAADRAAIRNRVRKLYQSFNQEDWSGCLSLVDPKLRNTGKIESERYVESLEAFKQSYGEVHLWLLRVSLRDDEKKNKHDDRPFAYVYVIWQDDQRRFHIFRERWVKESGRWFTRVVGLVAHKGSTNASAAH